MYISDAEFYESYDWCLNPILTLDDLRKRIREELDRRESVDTPWQREETTINLYLLICAACCTIDDYLAYRPFKLEAILHRFPRFGGMITVARTARNIPYTLGTLVDRRRVRRWRQDVLPCVDAVCSLLIAEPETREALWKSLRTTLQPVLSARLPADPLKWRMRIPEAFRCQDLSHHDVAEMAKRLVESHHVASRSYFVVAPRTAGAYFAPLLKACLAVHGVSVLAWITLRPKEGVSREEMRELSRLVATGACALIIDDHPNTGRTLMTLASLVQRFGARDDNIIVLAPDHPAQIAWAQAVRPISTVALPQSEFYKQRLLDDPAAVTAVLRELYSNSGWEDVRLQSNDELDAANRRLSAHYGDGFHVRLKRVFDIQLTRVGHQPVSSRIVAKSVGWGWLAYHAYIAGARLHGFVPSLIGLRQGLLFTEWIGPLDSTGPFPNTQEILSVVPSYVAARVGHLRLAEDPAFGSVGYRWTGWDRLVDILRRPYGLYIGHLMAGLIRKRLKDYIAPSPTMVDGRMTLTNWVENGSGVYKTDFEQHNFGGAEPDIVDPAYDLASAVEYLDPSEDDEQQLVDTYVRLSGDVNVSKRILLYKLLHATAVMQYATFKLNRNPSPTRGDYLNRLYVSARNFLTYHMNRYNATALGELQPPVWSDRLFCLDLDGILEAQIFGDFPQTTPGALMALRALRACGHSVILNTGRSVDQVRSYCRSYALPGGVAEFGSVLVDNIARREVPLVGPGALEQLNRCHELIRQLPGVFTDPTCRWTVRAFRYTDRNTIGLATSEVQRFLTTFDSEELRVITRDEDTYFVSRIVNKGTGLLAVKQYREATVHSTAGIGKSAEDLDMLRLVDVAYVLANASPVLKALTDNPKCHLVRRPGRMGLLAAVQDLLGDDFAVANQREVLQAARTHPRHLLDELLYATDRPRHCQLADFLRRRIVLD